MVSKIMFWSEIGKNNLKKNIVSNTFFPNISPGHLVKNISVVQNGFWINRARMFKVSRYFLVLLDEKIFTCLSCIV